MEYELKLTKEDLVIINNGLIKLPYKDVALLINKINNQINANQTEITSNNDK